MPDGNVKPRQLRSLLESYELLERSRSEIDADMAGVLKEVRSNGYDVAAFKALVRKRKTDAASRTEQDELVRLYESAVIEAEATARALAASEAGA